MRIRTAALCLVACLAVASPSPAETVTYSGSGERITLVIRDTSITEALEMLARKEHVSIVLGADVEGEVSVSLYDVSVDHAIRAIARAGGYATERRGRTYMIVDEEQVGQHAAKGSIAVRSFRIDYSDPQAVADVVSKHLSRYGEVTVIPLRRMIVVEDQPDFIARAASLVEQIDVEPRQILLEAKILEITLDRNDFFGIDWEHVFSFGKGSGALGVRGQSSSVIPGLFVDVVNNDIEAALNALSEKGRLRTLSTPSLLALEYEEAEVVIGDRLGYRVTSTINQVTTESVQFLESGVILRFTASIDRRGRIMLDIHPEVSTGLINGGLPDQTTAEVTTKLLLDEGEQIFIGGLIKNRLTNNRSGIPYLSDLPIFGRLFGGRSDISASTETVIVVRATSVEEVRRRKGEQAVKRLPVVERDLEHERVLLEELLDTAPIYPPLPGSAAPEGKP